jgi:hypothetical protein
MLAAADTAAWVGQLVGTAPVPEDVGAAELVGVPVGAVAPLEDVAGEAEPHAASTAPHMMASATARWACRADAWRVISGLREGSNAQTSES